ncbi:branched-chain amino acid ABC transporter permease [Ochrobactrum sp. EDr1-4]|uniref:branched-chain amino acid ABC transporter permease n=1 Tax=Ochrobactrum sp. EDr1-4 TaxID=3368622 RepID=UPI003BA00619
MKTLNNPYFQFLLAVVAVLVMPLLMKSGILATEILIFALAVTACNLLLGYTGLLSFGQGIFFGSGSYIAGILLTRTGIPAGLMLPVAIVGGAALAALVGWFAIRRQGVYFVMLTLAFSQLFFFLAYTFSDLTGGDNGLLDVPRPSFAGETLSSPWSYYVYVAIVFLVVFALLLRAIQSTFGRTLIAIRENEERAIAVGYPIKAFKVAAFAISGAVTALAGALHAMLIGVAPLTNIEHHTSEVILIMTIIGGSTSLIASVIGAASYLLLADWLSVIWPRWLLLLGLALIVVSLFAQKGLWGLLEKLVAALSSRREEAAKPDAAEEK